MPGLITMYTEFADDHVKRFEKKGKLKKISRAKVEYQLLQEINKADLVIDCKLSWTHAILSSLLFDALWESISRRLKLPKACTACFVPDPTLVQFEEPSDDEAEDGAQEANDGIEEEIHDELSVSQIPALTNDHNSRPSSPDPISSSGSTTPQSLLDRAAKVVPPGQLAAQLALLPRCETCHLRGHDSPSCPVRLHEEVKDWVSDAGTSRSPEQVRVPAPAVRDVREDSRTALSDADSSAREGDDSPYQESSSHKKGAAKAKKSTAKAASKPQGVTKKKAVPKQKLQTPAQLMTAAAKTREPVQPKAPEKPSATPRDTTTTPARVSNRNNKAAQSSTAASHVATDSVHTSDGNKARAQAATVQDEIDQKLARIQANMAPAQAQGLKRMMEQFPDDDEDSPATKKAKTGGAAVGNGGRKIATTKDSNKKKGLRSGTESIVASKSNKSR